MKEKEFRLELLKTRLEAQHNLTLDVLKAGTIFIVSVGFLIREAFTSSATKDNKIAIATALILISTSCLIGNFLIYRTNKHIDSDIVKLLESCEIGFPLLSFQSGKMKSGLFVASLIEFALLVGSIFWLLRTMQILF